MDQTDQKKQAWLTSLRMLAATPKSRKQLEKKLIDKGYFAEVVEEILNRLEETHILNDKAYATNVISRYQVGKSSGRKRIEFELKKRGVSGNKRQSGAGGSRIPRPRDRRAQPPAGSASRILRRRPGAASRNRS